MRLGVLKRSFLFFFCLQLVTAKAIVLPQDSVQRTKTKKIIFTSTTAAITTGSLIYLNRLWYKPYSSTEFHLFNDNEEWLQMDKVGHIFTTYSSARILMQIAEGAGFTNTQSRLIGGWTAFGYMTAIEFMDGFSSGWGFSWGDMEANFGGSMLAVSQQFFWNEQRISLKYSFHQTSYAAYRPNLLGNNLLEQTIKDYNGQTYWLSANIASFLRKGNRIPQWLNVAFGYGAVGMISGYNNYIITNADGSLTGNKRYRKCMISMDIDLTKIKTRSRFLRNVFSVVNCFKIPFPALEINAKKMKGYLLYY